MEVLNSGWLNEGPMVQKFETLLSKQLGLVQPVALNSGTSALHLALVLAGVKAGDEVVLPAQTFIATGMVILQQGAIPVFADIQRETGNIDPASIQQKITSKTKAIIAVHWGGYPCDLEEIHTIAKEHGLVVIEDAAHALGATYQNKPIGALSTFTAFSFQAIKHLTTGDGGALCCLHHEDALRVRRLRWFGMDRGAAREGAMVSEIGYKYNLNDLGAAVGLGNLMDFESRLRRRREIGTIYRRELARVPGLKLPIYEQDRVHAYWLFTVLVEERTRFMAELKEEGIPTSVVDLRIDKNPVFGGLREDLIHQDWFDWHQVAIPLHEGLTDSDVQKIVQSIQSGW